MNGIDQKTNIAETRSNILAPKLRFKEFGGEWKNKKLGEGIELISGQHLSPGEYNTDKMGVPYFTGPSDFTSEESKVTKWSLNSSHFGFKKDILITVKGSGVGKMSLLKLNKAAMGRQLMAIRSSAFNSEFVFHFLFLKTNYFVALASGNMIPGLSRQDILTLKFKIPTLPEQLKIASFLSAVDEKIEQLTRKKELLEQYKKGAMQNLFSGKLRFKGDDGKDFPDWEEKRLGDVADFLKGKGISKLEIDNDGKTECIRYGQLYTDYKETISKVISRTSVSTKDLVLSKANDVIIPASGETQIDIATASCVLRSGIALGGDLNIIRTNMSGVFLSYYLNTHKKFDIARLSQGISVVHLYPSQLGLLKLSIPCLEEQQKIATYLSAIDTKIESVANQINQTQTFKKGLLQQMFV